MAPGRLAALPRKPKSPAKVGSESPPTNSELEPQIETQAVLSGAQSPTSPELEPEPILVSYDGSGQAAAVSADHSPKGTEKTEKTLAPLEDGLIKVPYRAPDKVALPDKEAAALSEKAKTLLSSKSRKSSIPRFSLSRLLNDPSDIQRMEKAQKLRDMLRQEMRKEKVSLWNSCLLLLHTSASDWSRSSPTVQVLHLCELWGTIATCSYLASYPVTRKMNRLLV